MLTFQLLLVSESIDPGTVALVRHQARGPTGLTPWSLWRADDGRFDLYQRIQNMPVFGAKSNIASFVVTAERQTVFVGLYEIAGRDIAPAEMHCPLMLHSAAGKILYDLRHTETLAVYAGRLFVDWGKGYKAWVQHAERRSKSIVRLTPTVIEPDFPGFHGFQYVVSEVEFVPESWRSVLKSSRGVYLLLCPETGVQYIGAAIGPDGFYGRWLDYVRDGHGGNDLLRDRDARSFLVSILEAASSAATTPEILGREAIWKRKLGSRVHGLNAN